MKIIVEDTISGIADAGRDRIRRLIVDKQVAKLTTEPLFNPTDGVTALMTGLSATEVARAERGFLHSELLFLVSLVDRHKDFEFEQRLPKWEFKELVTAQRFYKHSRPTNPNYNTSVQALGIELHRLHHRKASSGTAIVCRR